MKRENAATITSTVDVVPQPYHAYNPVPDMVSDANRNASIASSTRTISGYAQDIEAATTVTAGTTTWTVTETVFPTAYYPFPVANTSTSLGKTSTISQPILTAASSSAGAGLFYPTSTSAPYPTSNTTSPSATGSSSTTANFTDPITRPTITPSPTITLPSALSTTLTLASTTVSSLLPIGTSVNPAGCPTINNTIYSLPSGQQYQVQCYRAYGGAANIGLDQPHLTDCMQECSTVNAGFSTIRCFGVTWLEYATEGIRCNLKSQTALLNYTDNYFGASAVLLTGVPPPVVGAFNQRVQGETAAGDEDENRAGSSGSAVGESIGGQLPDTDAGTWRLGRVP
ncbi:MAG: hypothetical protein Q9218_002108 [Villophora microphyllina]